MTSGGIREGAGRKSGPKKIRRSVYVLPETWEKLKVIGNGKHNAGIEKLVAESMTTDTTKGD